jgi:hypothetical protein
VSDLTGINDVFKACPNKYVNLDFSGSAFPSIGTNAFTKCTSLTSIIIPNSVKSIGNEAFKSCTSLTSVNIPNSVTNIEASIFSRCTSLTSVNIESGVTRIENYAFYNCISLASITIPVSIVTIQNNAFKSCNSLSNVTFQGTIPSKGFSSIFAFPGNLRTKFYELDKANGKPGTYIRAIGSKTWTRQWH